MQLFATKTQPLMRVLTGDVSNFKKHKGAPVFKELTKDISEFLLNLICELRFRIKMDDDPFSATGAMEFELDYIGSVLT